MKLLITGDWHLDTRAPKNRTDDYTNAQFAKIQQLFACAEREGIPYILQPGDCFNSFKASHWLVRRYGEYFYKMQKATGTTVITVFGQHDMRYHASETDNTPLAVLHACSALHALIGEASNPNNPFEAHRGGSIVFYGAGWGQEIPKPDRDQFKHKTHVLITHRMVLGHEKLWDGQKEYNLSQTLLGTYDYDLIVSGDNHETFQAQREHRVLLNAGSLMRMAVDQVAHKPCFYIYDTSDRTYEKRFHTVENFSRVMDVEREQERRKRNKELESFVEKLEGEMTIGEGIDTVKEGLDFLLNLKEYFDQENADEGAKRFIEETMNDEE